MSLACQSDLACFRNDGHAGDHAYATPETVPQPVAATPAPLDTRHAALVEKARLLLAAMSGTPVEDWIHAEADALRAALDGEPK